MNATYKDNVIGWVDANTLVLHYPSLGTVIGYYGRQSARAKKAIAGLTAEQRAYIDAMTHAEVEAVCKRLTSVPATA